MLLDFNQLLVIGALPTRQRSIIKKLFAKIELSINEWLPAFGLDDNREAPIVAVCVHSDLDALKTAHSTRLRPNNVEFVDVVLQSQSAGKRKKPNIFFIDESPEKVKGLILKAEQILSQRFPVRSPKNFEIFSERFNLIGSSPAFLKTIKAIRKVSKTESRVFVKGETGTGKELVARAIHYMSPRASGPFVPVNCGAFTDELLLSELFGHKKGSFTGAIQDQSGLIELADKGTLFLDEVDSLSSKAQVSLLRYLQEGEIRPVGGRALKTIDARVVSASNKKLSDLVRTGAFRDDLLYRLDVLSLSLPPLRLREKDLFLVAMQILNQLSSELNVVVKTLSPDFLSAMASYDWPGNFRELESALTRSFLMTEGSVIDNPDLIFSEIDHESNPIRSSLGSFNYEKQLLVRRFEKDYLESVLSSTAGNVTKAAAIAKKERRAFTRLMEKHGINRAAYI